MWPVCCGHSAGREPVVTLLGRITLLAACRGTLVLVVVGTSLLLSPVHTRGELTVSPGTEG